MAVQHQVCGMNSPESVPRSLVLDAVVSDATAYNDGAFLEGGIS